MGVAFSPWRVQPGSLLPVSVSSCVLVSLHLAHLWKEGKTITNQVQNSHSKTRQDVPPEEPCTTEEKSSGKERDYQEGGLRTSSLAS